MTLPEAASLLLFVVVAVFGYAQHRRAEGWKHKAIGWQNKAEHLEWKSRRRAIKET